MGTPDDDAANRDAVLRRMLATPKPGKDGKKGAEAKPTPKPARPPPARKAKGKRAS